MPAFRRDAMPVDVIGAKEAACRIIRNALIEPFVQWREHSAGVHFLWNELDLVAFRLRRYIIDVEVRPPVIVKRRAAPNSEEWRRRALVAQLRCLAARIAIEDRVAGCFAFRWRALLEAAESAEDGDPVSPNPRPAPASRSSMKDPRNVWCMRARAIGVSRWKEWLRTARPGWR